MVSHGGSRRRKITLWWLMLIFGGFGVAAWGALMTVMYGVNSPGGVLGVVFVVLGTWNASKCIELRRYVWYGELDR